MRRLLSAPGKQLVRPWFGNSELTGKTDQAALDFRDSLSGVLRADDSSVLRLRAAFLDFQRRQTYEALLIREARAALRASPQAKSSFLWVDFSEIHGRPIKETFDFGHFVPIIPASVLAQQEVSTRDVVVNVAIGLRTGI